MSSNLINFNGQIIPSDSKLLTIQNRAFRYGDGFFESMCMLKGHLKLADMHCDRLQRGMQSLKINGYSQMDTWFLKEMVEQLGVRNKAKHARLRLTVFREGEGLYTPSQNAPGYCLEMTPVEEPRYFLNPKGLIVDIFNDVPKPLNYLSNIKTCNALTYVMAAIFKGPSNLDERLVGNE